MTIGRRPNSAVLMALLAVAGGSVPSEAPKIHRPRRPKDEPPPPGRKHRRGRGKRSRRFSALKQLAWDREALGLKTLPKDLHPHVRKRELLRRAAGSPLGVCIGAVIFASTWLMLLGIVALLVGFACFVQTRRQYRQKIGGRKR